MLITVPNLIVIGLMLGVFALAVALALPEPSGAAYNEGHDGYELDPGSPPAADKELPPDHLLPDKQPAYVRSAVYLFGALTIVSLVLVILSGTILAVFGPQWWHTNSIGHFFNSLHLWSVEALFFFMVLHLWGMFFLGAWRDNRGRTWVMGAVALAASMVEAFTGYLSQTNFDSQWIAVSAKDMFNGLGIAALFNVLNFGQMYGLHILVIPVALIGLVALGILGAQPSARELEATGMSFALNALLPWLAPRGAALTDGSAGAWPPRLAATLVALALLVGYVPMGLALLLGNRARRIPLCMAAAVSLSSAACAGIIRQDVALAGPDGVRLVDGTTVATSPVASAPTIVDQVPARVAHWPDVAWDRWYVEPGQGQSPQASHVEIVGANYRYQYLVNGEPQVIRGMGLNTQYSQLLSPTERATRLDNDMAEMQTLGVNTVVGWDPAEFDGVLLDAAQRHHIGVVMPFDLNPEADYTDPAVRRRLHDEVMAWVARYRTYPALRMWGLGNEVLHKIVHPAWVGPQDPQRQRQAEAFSDWLVETADAIHAVDPYHPVTYRSAEDAFVDWVIAALNRRGGGPRPWFVWGTNCYQKYLENIVDTWPDSGMPLALWVSEFAPGGLAVPDRPDGFATMWGYIRRRADWVLGGAVDAWTRNGPEGIDRNFGLTDDGQVVDGRSLDMLNALFHAE